MAPARTLPPPAPPAPLPHRGDEGRTRLRVRERPGRAPPTRTPWSPGHRDPRLDPPGGAEDGGPRAPNRIHPAAHPRPRLLGDLRAHFCMTLWRGLYPPCQRVL